MSSGQKLINKVANILCTVYTAQQGAGQARGASDGGREGERVYRWSLYKDLRPDDRQAGMGTHIVSLNYYLSRAAFVQCTHG